METFKFPAPGEWSHLTTRAISNQQDVIEKVRPVLDAVKRDKDKALKEFTERFDGVSIDSFAISEDEIREECLRVDSNLKGAINNAIINIRKFHEAQIQKVKKVETAPGVVCWQRSTPIEKVGLYIPGGSAPLFSTVLMLAIPADIAGCKEIVLCSPPGKDGKIHPAILFAAHIAGVTKIYKAGGAQAIAAMAYGTETIPAVDKIFGPGNSFVTAAKQLITLDGVAIDLPAGPSEVEVMADESANPEFVASDLLSQAEHGPDSQSILVTDSENMIKQVEKEIEKQLKTLPRTETAKKALKNSRMILLKDISEMIDFTNQYAPEHLILSVRDYNWVSEKIVNAGSVFLGNYTPESAGDYASGTNHTLPTYGYAKAYSGVNLDSFCKKITFQEITPKGLQKLGPTIETMAAAEQLEAHKMAVSLRTKNS
ncbi:histidinol dehydrogenase [Marinilabilia rubra]|uniref:Histidinol dehydrogenase n=1 Tax=Marinilabilia rubra TaxID=2162893 RepID=A0A2U2BDW1_9BACT|nr:histidinol dehydrogenase [Marinilabilia rubra]PWE01217.1 histidinol dehydrogenase [Marinilabilia rubra]